VAKIRSVSIFFYCSHWPASLHTIFAPVVKSRLYKESRRRKVTRRIAKFALCVFLFTPAMDVAAQSRAARYMPTVGSIGTTLRLRRTVIGPASPATNNHPLFHTSYMGEPDRVVARTAYGNVTARDLYVWLIMREGPHAPYLLESYDKARTQSEKKSIAKAIQDEIDEYVFTNFVVPKVMGNTPCDGTAAVKEELYTLPIYQLAYIKHVIEPMLCVLPADRVKYLQEHKAEITPPDRWRTRYIFMATDFEDPLEEQDAVDQQMTALRDQIVAGEITFAEAARQHSQAPSAGNGGEIPPIRRGELFFFYEDAAAALQPGEVSPIFRGPRGLYMVQLIDVLPGEAPNLDDPQQAMKVDEALTRQILREAYDWDFRSMLIRQRRPVYRHANWDLLDDCDPVAEVCDFELTKQQLREAFPEIERDDLKLRRALVNTWVHTIIERAVMRQEVRNLGRDGDEIIQRGRWMAANLVRRDGFVDRLRCGLDVSEGKVREFWNSHPELATPLAVKRLIRLTLTPLNTAPLPEQTNEELERVLVEAGGGAPTVALRPGHVVKHVSSRRVVEETLLQTEEVFQALEDDTPETTTSSELLPLSEPASLSGNVAMEIDDAPVTSTVMIPGLEPLPAPGAVTTTTLVEARGGGTSDPPAGGGCVPLTVRVAPPPHNEVPLPGLVDEEQNPQFVPPRLPASRPAGAVARTYSSPGAMEPVPNDSANWSGDTVIRPAEPVPPHAIVNYPVAPAIGPALELERAPNENGQLPPPPTSNYAYNPDWFYARLDLTVIRDLVKNYLSSDFVLRFQDLGYVYVEDHPEIPARVDAVPTGAFSRPVLLDNQAVAYYVEDSRRPAKPAFDEIKTQAYATYTQVQLDKSLQSAYRTEMGKAAVNYTFEVDAASLASARTAATVEETTEEGK